MNGSLGLDLLGPTAASRYLGVSRTTLHRLVKAGELVPTQRTSSGYRRFSTRELHRFLSMRTELPSVEAAKSEDLLGDSLLRQSVLLDLAERICGPHTVESVCMAAVTVARDTLRSGERGSVWLVDDNGEALLPRANVGYLSNLDVSPFAFGGDSITARALRTGQPIVCEDTILRPLEGSNAARTLNADLRAFVAVPILGPKAAHGFLLVGSRHPASFPAEDIGFLTRLTKLLSHSLETALHIERCEQVYETIQDLSDGLIAGRTGAELASLAASALGRLSRADVVLISVESNASVHAVAWLAAWSPRGLTTEELPPVPHDRTMSEQLRNERRTFRIDNVESYRGMEHESKSVGIGLGIPTWHVAPLNGPSGPRGAISLGFKARTQLSQPVLRSICAVALHLGLVLSSLPHERTS